MGVALLQLQLLPLLLLRITEVRVVKALLLLLLLPMLPILKDDPRSGVVRSRGRVSEASRTAAASCSSWVAKRMASGMLLGM